MVVKLAGETDALVGFDGGGGPARGDSAGGGLFRSMVVHELLQWRVAPIVLEVPAWRPRQRWLLLCGPCCGCH